MLAFPRCRRSMGLSIPDGVRSASCPCSAVVIHLGSSLGMRRWGRENGPRHFEARFYALSDAALQARGSTGLTSVVHHGIHVALNA